MSESVKMEKETDQVRKEDARVGYQVAVDFWTYQGQLNWNRYNVLLVANSIIMAVIGAVYSNPKPLPFLTIGFAVVGLVLCLDWILVTARGFDIHKFWGYCAWELEERYLKGTVTTVSDLQAYIKEGSIEFKEIGKEHDFGPLSKISQRVVAYTVIAAFIAAFLISILHGILVLLDVL